MSKEIDFQGREEEIRINSAPIYLASHDNEDGLAIYEITGLGGTDLAAGHYYQVILYNRLPGPDGVLAPNFRKRCDYVRFQDGPIPTNRVNGVTNEAMLAILIHRTKTLNERFPCEENEKALFHMKSALDWFNTRTEKRKVRGVEGHLKE